ncbi:hypothetical protein FRB95_004516 [Tulasnella sp. JGI-2019a]|nr:hypothetical protein FRB95_004516 [Tulasnella sp. JGI-2019a]
MASLHRLRGMVQRNGARLQSPLRGSVHCIRGYSTPGPTGPSGNTTPRSTYVFGALALIMAGAVGSRLGWEARNAQVLSTADSDRQFEVFGTTDDFKNAIAQLRQELAKDAVSTEPEMLESHGFSMNSYHPGKAHSVVVFPNRTEDVVVIMKIATKYRMPVVAYSGGTSLEGHFSGIDGGCICVDMSGMNRILEIHEADSDVICQPGISWEELNATLKEEGISFFFPLDPGPGATIGGMIGTGCSGTNAVKYGTAKSHWFLNVTVVLPNGEVIKTRSRAKKSSAGFDLTKLFIGAEGTLGIVTEATLRLTPLVPTSVAVAAFPDVRNAASAVQEIVNSTAGDSLQCIELVDDNFMRATNKFGQSQRKYVEKDSLFFKLQGSASSIKENAKIIQGIVKKHGGLSFELAKSDQEAADLWRDRKNALFTSLALVPGSRGWSTDVCVPMSRLPDLVHETKKDLKDLGIVSTIVGHAGDGNFHALLLFTDDEELPAVREAVHRLVERALKMDGTCTGEHGVGIGKKEYLYRELGEGTVDLMKRIKRVVDPLGIMNPGKLYPNKETKTHKPHVTL